MKQTWPNLEIIIVDDGSTDETDKCVAQQLTGLKHGRTIKYHNQDNSGASVARNQGLAIATGRYVQFLDADDIIFPDKVSLQVAILEQPENTQADVCCCYGQIGKSVSDSMMNQRIGVFCRTPREYVHVLCSRVVHGMQTSAPLWRRSFLVSRPGWRTDINLGDDLEYHIRLLATANSMAFVERELFWVREHLGPRLSDMGKDREKMLSQFRTRKAIYDTLAKAGLWNETTQKNFLGTMRTIYANVLASGTDGDIGEMEGFIRKVAFHPNHRLELPALVAMRRLVGKGALLGAHRLLTGVKG
jgi:glycosyltransferase involved in cell wall biosynthesis